MNIRGPDRFRRRADSALRRCAHCGRIIGHGMESGAAMFCCNHCAKRAGVEAMRDRA